MPVVSVLQHLGGPARETGSLCPAGPSEHQPQFPPSFPDQPFSVLSDSISVLKLSSDGPIQICILYIFHLLLKMSQGFDGTLQLPSQSAILLKKRKKERKKKKLPEYAL